MTLPKAVRVYEVGLRDGLQNEATLVPTQGKIEILNALLNAGVSHIEATSFVSPKWIPQMGDADQFCSQIQAQKQISYSALIPNSKGMERALLYPQIDTFAVFLSASESHNKKNVNRTVAESLKGFEEVIPEAKKQGKTVRAYISTVWGCPYEGVIDPQKSLAIALELKRLGADTIALGDTIGIGTPGQTQSLCDLFLKYFDEEDIALHLHDTRGTALANALIGLQAGISQFDASVGGMGGCPYAPGASGNLATEDLVYMLHGLGIHTGIDLSKLVEAGKIAQQWVARALPGRYLTAALASQSAAK